jgi:hypothetical protein
MPPPMPPPLPLLTSPTELPIGGMMMRAVASLFLTSGIQLPEKSATSSAAQPLKQRQIIESPRNTANLFMHRLSDFFWGHPMLIFP